MSAVGILANPASGKDIRRLVAHGSVFDNHEKANIVSRVLLGLEAAGVERAWIMPDSFGIGVRALDEIRLTSLCASILDVQPPCTYTSEDTLRATTQMVQAGAACLVTLGGDGTNRLVAKGCGDVPLMPISTGTNNVFPTMIEGTLAGLAAGLVALGLAEEAVQRLPYLEIACPDTPPDIALVDVAVYDERFVAARAVWDPARILELVLARAEPGTIGLSSIGAHMRPNSSKFSGMYLRMGQGGRRVLAPIGPGLVTTVSVAASRALGPGDEVRVCQPRPCTLAFDGERELALAAGSEAAIRLRSDGPRVIDVKRTMAIAARHRIFIERD